MGDGWGAPASPRGGAGPAGLGGPAASTGLKLMASTSPSLVKKTVTPLVRKNQTVRKSSVKAFWLGRP